MSDQLITVRCGIFLAAADKPSNIRHTLRQIAALSAGQRFQTAGRARASSRFASASRSETNVLVGIISISNDSTLVRIVFNFSTCFFVICVVPKFLSFNQLSGRYVSCSGSSAMCDNVAPVIPVG